MALGKMTTICGSDRVTARTRAHTRTRTHARAFFDLALTPGHGIGEPADARVPSETCYATSRGRKSFLCVLFAEGLSLPCGCGKLLRCTLPYHRSHPSHSAKAVESVETVESSPLLSLPQPQFPPAAAGAILSFKQKRRIKYVMRGVVKGQYPHRILIVFHIFV